MPDKQIQAWIGAHWDEILDDLRKFLRQPSVSAQKWGVAEMAHICADMLKQYGVNARIVPFGHFVDFVFGEKAAKGLNGAKTLLIYNHYDVQPVEPLDLWTSPPFEPTIRDGKIFARGVCDDKGEIIVRLAAIRCYQKLFGPLPVNLKWLIEGEEEIGSPGVMPFVRNNAGLLNADYCIWESGGVDYDGRPDLTMGCKGILYIELACRTAGRDLHSANAAVVPSPVWRLLQALATLKDKNERILIDGFYNGIRKPTQADLAAVRAEPSTEQQFKKAAGIKAFFKNLKRFEFRKQLYFQPTCNIAGIWSGYTGPGGKTVLPCEARCKIDFRLVPDMDPDDILRKLKKHLKKKGYGDIEVLDIEHGEHPARTPIDHPFVSLVKRACEKTHGKKAILSLTTAGTGPMYPFAKYLRVPIVSIGSSYPDAGAHAPDEHWRLNDIKTGIEQIVNVFRELAVQQP
ncbi:MAG: M20/M25/M40 family metallo-hydrolase [bacterium]